MIPQSGGSSSIRKVGRQFDISDSWINRKIGGKSRQIVNALIDVEFEIKRGETFGLVGESGSGKSTLARIVVGLLEASQGEVVIDSSLQTVRAGCGRGIQMVFQDPFASLNPRWRVERIVAEPIRTLNLASEKAQLSKRIDELLKLVGLHPDDRKKYPHQFSGGQRQRVAIARALASEAQFIVCDEPTSALDVSVQAQILNLMRRLQERLGLTYLFISHDLAVVRYMATRVGVLYLGRIVEIGEVAELFANPRHPYTKMLIEAVPKVDGDGTKKRRLLGEIPSPINPPAGCAFHPRCPMAVDRCRRDVPRLIDQVACHVANAR